MLTESIKNKVLQHLKIKTNVDNWVFLTPGIESNESIVYRLTSSYSKDLALKIYTSNNSSALQAKCKAQYSAIEHFYSSNTYMSSRYRTPQPFGLFEENGFYLMEWVSGNSLQDTLWKNCLFKRKLQNHIKESYNWLNHYHSQANLDVMVVDLANYSKSIEYTIRRIESQEFCNNNLVFKSGYKAFNQFANHFTGHKAQHADIHGDLNLSNIILSDNHIFGIDIGAVKHAPIENDIAQMLNYICVNYFLMLPRLAIRENMSKWDIFNVALDSYGYPKDIKAREFFLFVFFYQALRRWLSIEHIHKKNKDNTAVFVLLGKWRKYNSSVIVKELTQVINNRYLK